VLEIRCSCCSIILPVHQSWTPIFTRPNVNYAGADRLVDFYVYITPGAVRIALMGDISDFQCTAERRHNVLHHLRRRKKTPKTDGFPPNDRHTTRLDAKRTLRDINARKHSQTERRTHTDIERTFVMNIGRRLERVQVSAALVRRFSRITTRGCGMVMCSVASVCLSVSLGL